LDDPRPGTVIAGRIDADNLGAPFILSALLVMQVLGPEASVSIGPSTFSMMAATLPWCGCKANRQISG
jgi:hypothetical protein